MILGQKKEEYVFPCNLSFGKAKPSASSAKKSQLFFKMQNKTIPLRFRHDSSIYRVDQATETCRARITS